MKLLHIIASPRSEASNTLRVSSALLDALGERITGLEVEEVELFQADLPAIAGDNIEAKYTLMVGQPIDKTHAESWKQIEREIDRFTHADAYVISTPMWNLSIPYALKYYIDCIVQPGYMFRYDELGRALPLVHGKKMVVVTSRGGDYSEASPLHAFDFQEPYLRAIFGFVGITDVTFVNAQTMDVSPEFRSASTANAIDEVLRVAGTDDWATLGAAA
ncbi:FMN-dependent NADH-azoreductase [Agromyces kandeliae]|uniref:FMN dependent NADH:quinone oxidoreductase n=1 Tax=Agromyces kandeliae TaxID=2666141 RepID=A0A6L5R5T2_9MICO|nr:NAD(P)H-dependent oxidoreductase [Agromyces kandeliae]MRX44487.1 ACP phosphodiesterase [Agromyces kandeliae]